MNTALLCSKLLPANPPPPLGDSLSTTKLGLFPHWFDPTVLTPPAIARSCPWIHVGRRRPLSHPRFRGHSHAARDPCTSRIMTAQTHSPPTVIASLVDFLGCLLLISTQQPPSSSSFGRTPQTGACQHRPPVVHQLQAPPPVAILPLVPSLPCSCS